MNKSEEIRREEPCSVMKPSCEEPAVNSGMKSGVLKCRKVPTNDATCLRGAYSWRDVVKL